MNEHHEHRPPSGTAGLFHAAGMGQDGGVADPCCTNKPPAAGQGHEAVALSAPRLALWFAGLVGLIIVALAVTFGLLLWLSGDAGEPVSPWETMSDAPVARATAVPELRPRQVNERLEHQRKQNERLTSYGWVDQLQGIAHIPIDRAIQLYRQQAEDNQQAEEQDER